MASKIPPAELVYQLERYHEDRSQGLIAVAVIFYVLAAVSVYLRFLARRIMKLPLRYDDWTIVAGLVGLTGIFILYVVGSSPKYGGIGKHVVRNGETTIIRFLQGLYAFNIIYTLTIPIVKISILMFYHRTFPNKSLRRATYVGIGFFILLALSTFLVDVFNCKPIRASWLKDIPSKCVDPPTLYRVTAIINLITDILILLLPLPLIWRLQMSLRNRIALYGIFLLGGFVCIATALRLPTFDKIKAVDVTWTYVPVAYFTYLEVSLAIVCANLPTMRPLAHVALKDVRNLSSRIRSGRAWSSLRSGNTDSFGSEGRRLFGRPFGSKGQSEKDLESGNSAESSISKPAPVATRGQFHPRQQRPASLPYIPTPAFEKGMDGRPFRDSMVSNLKLGTPMAEYEAKDSESGDGAYFDYKGDPEKDMSLYGSTITKDS